MGALNLGVRTPSFKAALHDLVFPQHVITGAIIGTDERMLNLPFIVQQHEEKLLWFGFHIAFIRSTSTVVNSTGVL